MSTKSFSKFEIQNKESYSIEVLSTDFVCLPIKNQPIKTTKGNYEFLKDTELADSGNCDQIHILIHFFTRSNFIRTTRLELVK